MSTECLRPTNVLLLLASVVERKSDEKKRLYEYRDGSEELKAAACKIK